MVRGDGREEGAHVQTGQEAQEEQQGFVGAGGIHAPAETPPTTGAATEFVFHILPDFHVQHCPPGAAAAEQPLGRGSRVAGESHQGAHPRGELCHFGGLAFWHESEFASLCPSVFQCV